MCSNRSPAQVQRLEDARRYEQPPCAMYNGYTEGQVYLHPPIMTQATDNQMARFTRDVRDAICISPIPGVGFNVSFRGSTDILYSESMLDAIDSRIVPVLKAMHATGFSPHNIAQYMEVTQLLWEQKWPILTRPGMTDIYIDCVHSIVNESDDIAPMSRFSLLVTAYQAAQTPCGVAYCCSGDTTNVIVSGAWLDQAYPGSVRKLEQGWTLDLSITELVAWVFTADVTDQAAIELPQDLVTAPDALNREPESFNG